MLFDLTFPCYLTTFSEKKCLNGKVICAFFLSRLSNSSFSCNNVFSLLILDNKKERISTRPPPPPTYNTIHPPSPLLYAVEGMHVGTVEGELYTRDLKKVA
jgi:hypothetical protein